MTNCARGSRRMSNWSTFAALYLLATTACESPTGPATGTNSGQRLSVGEATTCAIGSDGNIWCWGQNSAFLEYGTSLLLSSSTPANTLISGLTSMASGHGQHMCAAAANNLAKCWGRNTFGQLGSNALPSTAETVVPLPFGNWIDLSVSRLTTCGVTHQFVAYCWGANQRGEGGNSTRAINEVARIPRGVESTRDFKSIAAGWTHACALTTLGEALCWGDNNHGQLGVGTTDTTVRRLPVPVQTTVRFGQISAGALYTCAISLDHAAYCWGNNATGALGDGTTVTRATPTLVSGTQKFKRILTSSGFAGGTTATLPVLPPGQVAHTCALTEANTAYCWGWNGAGQVGDGTFTNRLAPVAVVGGKTFTEIGLGGTHTCGMLSGAISCWGSNLFGQLGTGNATSSATPQLVSAPFNVAN